MERKFWFKESDCHVCHDRKEDVFSLRLDSEEQKQDVGILWAFRFLRQCCDWSKEVVEKNLLLSLLLSEAQIGLVIDNSLGL